MKKINFKKILSFKNAAFLLFIFGAIFLFGQSAAAVDVYGALGNIIGGVISFIIRALASILILLVNVMMSVASYSKFIEAPAVDKGWVVVRDLCNMFFVVVLLIIAFATILGQEEYGAKKYLPKLIMAAVLINFSKLICGLMIDLSSVVMLTFVNAFSAIGAANILDMLGISYVTQIAVDEANSEPITFGMIVTAYIFGFLYVLIATIVVAAMLGMLVVRLVMIWILVVLSPLAFFLQAVPGASKYASEWWSKWTSNLIVGPVIAFFLWLSFASLQGASVLETTESDDINAANGSLDQSVIGSKAGTVASMANFVIAIGMLIGGMQIAQNVGGVAAGAMGKIFNKGKGYGMKALNKISDAGKNAGKNAGKAVGRGVRNTALLGIGTLANSASERDEITGKKKGNNVGNFALQWRNDLVGARKKEKAASREKFLKKIGIGENAAEKAQDVYNDVKNNSVVQSLNSVIKLKAFNKKYKTAKAKKEAYELSGDKSTDETVVNSLRAKMIANPDYTSDKWTGNEIIASERTKEYNKNSKIVKNRIDNPAFSTTGKALKNMTEKQKKAKDRVGVMAKTPDYFSDLGKGGIYRKDGINDDQRRWLDMLNNSSSTDTDPSAYQALQNAIGQVDGTGAKQLNNDEANSMAMLLAAYKKGGGNMKALNDLDNALRSTISGAGIKSTNSDDLSGQVLVNYRAFDKNEMILNEGQGGLEYDAFAQNAVKKPGDRDTTKEIMGVSFAKINTLARDKGIDFKLDPAAAVNLGKGQVGKVSLLLSSLLESEISALESNVKEAMGNNPVIKSSQERISNLQKELGEIEEPNSINGLAKSSEIKRAISNEQQIIEKETTKAPDYQKLNQVKAAKKRFDDNDLSSLSLNNTDVIYKGTDSEKRIKKYNSTQHEGIHKAGAKDEALTDESADALQEARLIGRIPGTKNRYDKEIGKMIAEMETVSIDPNLIRKAVAEKIDSWKVSNAQRVIETEKGSRQTVSEAIKENEEESTNKETAKGVVADTKENDYDSTKSAEEITKLTLALEKTIKSSSGGQYASKIDLSTEATNFFRKEFGRLTKATNKIAINTKPIEVMAANDEIKIPL